MQQLYLSLNFMQTKGSIGCRCSEKRKWKKEMENIMDNISFLCYLHQANHPYMIKNHPMNHWYTSSLSLGIKTIIRYLPTIPVWNNALNLTHLLMKWVLMKYLFVISKDQQQIKIKTSIYPKYFVFGFNSFDPFFFKSFSYTIMGNIFT